MKKALITGCQGQDGSYLASYLLRKGYEVHGISRGFNYENYVFSMTAHIGDMRDETALENIFRKVMPDEVYNLAGQVFVPTSWSKVAETFDVNVGGLARLLKIAEQLKPDTRIYQASSSEMYGNIGGLLHELSPMNPVSPYGVSKLAAHKLVAVYREKGMYVVSGILFNHESPRRSEHMVTRKITRCVAKWVCGDEVPLELGNKNAARDWGSAEDYVIAMHSMLTQYRDPEDYVIGTGETHTVEEFVHIAAEVAGKENLVDKLVKYNTPAYTRPNELFSLKACARKANIRLGWEPKISFVELVRQMVTADIMRESKRKELVVA